MIALGLGGGVIYYASVGAAVPSLKWIALSAYTIALFWYLIEQRRRLWKTRRFWLSVAICLGTHLLLAVGVLKLLDPEPLWFVVTFPAELIAIDSFSQRFTQPHNASQQRLLR